MFDVRKRRKKRLLENTLNNTYNIFSFDPTLVPNIHFENTRSTTRPLSAQLPFALALSIN